MPAHVQFPEAFAAHRPTLRQDNPHTRPAQQVLINREPSLLRVFPPFAFFLCEKYPAKNFAPTRHASQLGHYLMPTSLRKA